VREVERFSFLHFMEGGCYRRGMKMYPQQGSWVSSKVIGVEKAEDTTSLPCSGLQG
jgi:hypothetical protein